MAGYLSGCEDLTELDLKGLQWSLKKQYSPLTQEGSLLFTLKNTPHTELRLRICFLEILPEAQENLIRANL